MIGRHSIRKVVKKFRLADVDDIRQDLEYWLRRPPEERLAAVELLRRQMYGPPTRLQRIARVVQRSQR